MKLGRVLALAPLQIAQALVGLGAIAVFTRLMSADEFGHYALALSASMLAHTLVFTWAEAAAFRFLSAARAQRGEANHFATLLVIAVVLGAFLCALTTAVLFFVSQEAAVLCAFMGGSIVMRGFTRIARESDRADLAVGRYAALETLYLLVGFAAGAALLLTVDLGPAAPFAGLLLAGVLVAVIDARRLLGQARSGSASTDRAVKYAAYGAPLALALAVDLAVQAAARIILAAQAGAHEVGAYAAAFSLARPLDLIFMAVGAALSPMLLRAYEENGAASIGAPARHGFALMVAIGLPAALALAILAAPLADILVGSSLSAHAARALPWLAFSGLATGLNLYYLSEAFQLTRRTGTRALVMLGPGAVQIALTLLWARDYGAFGAAAGAFAGALIGAILLFTVGRRLLPLPLPLAELGRVAAAAALMGAALLWMPGNGVTGLALKLFAGCLAYGAAAIALNIAGVRSVIATYIVRPNAPTPHAEHAHAR